jgi:inhibitor of cysteine peptidase
VTKALCTILVIFLLAACAPIQPHAVLLDAGDGGGNVALEPGQLLSVVLDANPTTGYRWDPIDLDEAVLAQVSGEFNAPATDAVGASATQTLIFRAVAPGATTLTLAYARPWESVEPAETFTVQVAVQ